MIKEKKLEIAGFEYILNPKDKVIGLITESQTNYTIILKPLNKSA